MKPSDILSTVEVQAVLTHFNSETPLNEIKQKISSRELAEKLGLDEMEVCQIAMDRQLLRMIDHKSIRGPMAIVYASLVVTCAMILFVILIFSAGKGPGFDNSTKPSTTALPSGDPNIIRIQP